MTALPARSTLDGSATPTTSAMKSALGALRDYLNEQLGAVGGAPVVPSLNGGQLAGLRNRVMNGNFAVNQRVVTGSVVLAAGAYGHDRFKAGASGCTYTFATSANVTTLTISAGSLIQVIEGNNLETGTYTLSWSGTAQGKIGAGSYAASGVTGVITGGTNTNIEFNTGTLSKVQLELGTTATVFEQRPYGLELALCQRYFYSYASGSGGNGDFGTGYLRSTTSFLFTVKYPVPMRIAPTTFAYSGSVGDYAYQAGVDTKTAVTLAIFAFGPESATVEATGSASTAGFGGRFYAGAGTRYLQFSADL